jgi:hypothetical protein
MRLFVVNYRFLFCGDVFTDGLRHAAADLGLTYEGAYWDDPDLPGKVGRFRPDLLFVVHGRKLTGRWGAWLCSQHPAAVWLVDEPYETDDTASWSCLFDTVFVNDPSTLHRHRNAHYLPMCFDPHVHRDIGAERIYKTGFVGNYSPTRARYLSALADGGLLGYVVGERWRNSPLQSFMLDGNVSAERTAELYQQTEIVVNVFRDKHNYNAQKIQAVAMNPRIYEALACGAIVVSERRKRMFPFVPQFDTPDALVDTVRRISGAASPRLNEALAGHSYADRLVTAMKVCAHNNQEAAYA